MLKAKKYLCILLSLIMISGTFSLAASAANVLIDEISISVNIEDGMILGNHGEYVTILSDNVVFEETDTQPVIANYSETYEDLVSSDAFRDDVAYDISIFLKAADGFMISDELLYVTVNGRRSGIFYFVDNDDNGTVDYIAVCLYEFEINAEPFTGSYIKKAEITIDTDIAGIHADDYADYIGILTEGLEFEDNYGDPAVYVNDSNYNTFSRRFKPGETYYLSVYLTATEGLTLDGYVDCFVDGEEVYSHVDCWYPDDDTRVEYVCFEVEITVDGEKELSFFGRIADFFRNLFERILSLFTLIPSPVPVLY